jgi:hypothetical protein
MTNTPNKANEQKKVGRPSSHEALVKRKLEQRQQMGEYRNRLPVVNMPNFQTCWVTEEKVDHYKQAMLYDLVAIDKENAPKIIEDAHLAEDFIKNGGVRTGTKADGSPQMSYLMARPIEIRDALRAEQQAQNDELMDQIVNGKRKASEHLSEEGDGENTYVRQSNFSVTKGERVL